MEENKMIIYTSIDGQTRIDVRLEDETLWLTQAQMCELYQTSKSNVSEHIKHIFEEGELEENSVFRREILYDHILQFGYDNSPWLSYQVRHSHPLPSMGDTEAERIHDKRLYTGR